VPMQSDSTVNEGLLTAQAAQAANAAAAASRPVSAGPATTEVCSIAIPTHLCMYFIAQLQNHTCLAAHMTAAAANFVDTVLSTQYEQTAT
jgi:hypothetical protein